MKKKNPVLRTRSASEKADAPDPATITPDMVGFRLLKLTNLLSRPFFSEFAQQHALSLSEWRAIVVLAAVPGSAAQDVAKATGLHPMNVSRAVIGLRKAELVREARDPANHRRVLLWLTERGQAIFDEIAPRSAATSARLLEVLNPAEMEQLVALVDKLIARAEVIGAAAGDDSAQP